MKHSLKEDEYVTVIKLRKKKTSTKEQQKPKTSLTLPFVVSADMQRSIATLAANVTAAEVTLWLGNNKNQLAS